MPVPLIHQADAKKLALLVIGLECLLTTMGERRDWVELSH